MSYRITSYIIIAKASFSRAPPWSRARSIIIKNSNDTTTTTTTTTITATAAAATTTATTTTTTTTTTRGLPRAGLGARLGAGGAAVRGAGPRNPRL